MLTAVLGVTPPSLVGADTMEPAPTSGPRNRSALWRLSSSPAPPGHGGII